MVKANSCILLSFCGAAVVGYGDAFAPTKPQSTLNSIRLSSTIEKNIETPSLLDTGTAGKKTALIDSLSTVQAPRGEEDANDGRSPVEIENEKFDCDESVEFWRNFQKDGFENAQDNVRNLVNIANSFAQTQGGADYWLRHTGRSTYFVANALLGNLGFRLHELLVKGNDTRSPYDGFVSDPSISTRMFLEVALCYEQDFKRIQEGKYKKPYDMYQSTRQSSPLYAGQQTSRFVREAIGTLSRRMRGNEEDKRIWLSDDASPSLYPDYYRTAFHYQTDGWMSQASAQVYETSTETLFLGRQDAMQRTALLPLVSLSTERKSDLPMKVLEIACGTGRFMTFARDSLPLDTEYTAVDLSPFYLDAARDNDANWRRVRSRVERDSQGPVKLKPSRLVQAKAEELPFEDDEFDAVVCVYLFHEIPREIRAQAAAEMARVVKPGGRVVLTDSTQLGDRPVYDKYMKNFEIMNEPYYVDYTEDNLPLHLESAGLECLTKSVCSSTKTLSFQKKE